MNDAGGADLSGTWRAAPAEGDLHQRFAERDFDDSDWAGIAVPGHWRSTEAFARADGPVLYRRRLDAAPPPAPGRRVFVVLDGIFYYGDVWLDGGYLGATEGYFTPHSFEVTDALSAQPPAGGHVLAVEVACPPERDRRAKRMVTGVFSHWDNLDPAWNPGGLWRPVRLVETGPVRIGRRRVLCTEATEDRGRLLVDVTLDAPARGARGRPPETAAPLQSRLVARLTGPGVALETSQEQTLAAGDNHLKWTLEVDRPPRWWPWRQGEQPLCDLELSVEIDGEVSDSTSVRTAFREIRLDGWRFHVNGERLFVMGSNQGPARMALAEAAPKALAADIAAARDANLDMLRLHAHVTRPEVYAAADELGVLLWQDLPLQWSYARGARRPAAAQSRDLVDLLGHHPSIVLWCGHNEPFPGPAGEPGAGTGRLRAAASVLLPTWNKDVLDRSVARSLSRSDPTRPVLAHSGVLPGPVRSGTDSHLYLGWYTGRIGDLADALRKWPRLGRFVSEFGAQAVPDSAAFMDPERWPDLDWPRLSARHALQERIFDRLVPPDEYATFDDWRAATQAYQATLIQLQSEDLRRLRHRPCGGFLQFCFADGHPAVTWSVLDHERKPKAGHAALAAACRSLLPMLDPRTGHVHVANELRGPFEGALVEVTVGEGTWRFEGDVAADAVTYIGRVELPAETAGANVILTHPDVDPVENAYPPDFWRLVRP